MVIKIRKILECKIDFDRMEESSITDLINLLFNSFGWLCPFNESTVRVNWDGCLFSKLSKNHL